MKANEAPEKVYVHVKDDKVRNTWNSAWIGVNDIEYTRTDAFIERALEWIRKEIRPYYSEVKYKYEDFKKYMEG